MAESNQERAGEQAQNGQTGGEARQDMPGSKPYTSESNPDNSSEGRGTPSSTPGAKPGSHTPIADEHSTNTSRTR